MILDRPKGTPRSAVHVLFANEKVREDDIEPLARVDVVVIDPVEQFRHVRLEALVKMKWTSFRLKDHVHLQDMLGLGLIVATWPSRLHLEQAERL